MTAELPVWVFGRCRWVSGVCRRTTCQDVLEAVLAVPQQGQPHGEQGLPDDAGPPGPAPPGPRGLPDASNYVIVERWKGVERRLDARVRILKVWSAWGEAQAEVQLLVRRVSEKGAGRSGSAAGHRRHRKRSGPGAVAGQPGQPGHGAKARPGHRPGRPSPTVKQHDQEEVHRLMRLILAQGETIAGQLRRLREREAQIERLEVEAHREREARHGKDYVLAAYLREHDLDLDAEEAERPAPSAPGAPVLLQQQQQQPEDTPRTTRQASQPGRPGGGIRPRQLVADDDLSHFADESDADNEGQAVVPGGQAKGQDAAGEAPPTARSASPPPEQGDVGAHIALWEKVVKVNKRLEQQEERLVRLYVGFRRSAPDGLAVDDRDQLRASLSRLQQDIDDGRRSLQANADLLTETEALLDAKRRLLRRLLAEMEAADMDTARLMAARDAALDAALPPPAPALPPPSPPPPAAVPTCTPCGIGQSHIKSHDNDSNSDTGLSSLHSSSEEGVYILDTLV